MNTIQKSESQNTTLASRFALASASPVIWRRAILTAFAGATLLAGCAGDSDTSKTGDPGTRPAVTTQYTLLPAQDCATVEKRLVEVATEQILQNKYETQYWLEDAAAGGNNANNSAPSQDRASDSPDDYTTTNNQEEGVDEADFVKTDGNYIYTLYGRDLVITKSWPAEETEEVGRITLADEGYPSALFLKGDKVAAFMGIWEDTDDGDGIWEPTDYFNGTRVAILDVSDRTAPRLERHLDIEAWMADARMIDGDVYMVSNGGFEMPFNIWDIAWDDSLNLPQEEYDANEARINELKDQARPIVKAEVERLVQGQNVLDFFPTKRILNSSGDVLASTPLYQCDELYLPQQLAQLGALNITHFDLDDKTPITTTGIVANGWQVYASEDNLYVSMSSNWWWWGWGNNRSETIIHQFNLEGAGDKPRYAASGKVDGWLLNQFSMSEYNGHLRVATTDNQWVWDETTGEGTQTGGNHLTILKNDQGELVETGSVRDLAPGEQVFSARFMGDKGYIVTFERTDPLFTFDLSDPTNPQLKGELKINGFSSYMHPMGDDHLLTIGQDATADGQVQGVHLQIFDVSDMDNPTRVQQHVLSTGSWSSWSEAMWDHHAFTYHPTKQLLAVPVNIHEWEDNNNESFSGLIVYRVDENTGFQEVGRVNHADLATRYYCKNYGATSWECMDSDYQWWTSVRRSIFIEDYLFSLSTVGMKVNDLLDPRTEHKRLMLLEEDLYR